MSLENMTIEPDGILLVDKPAGMTSHDVVWRVRKLFGTKKVGHTGTLDPLATGVLVVLLGRAAKACEYVSHDEKVYEATLRLGLTTDTEDVTGTTLTVSDSLPTPEQVEEELDRHMETLNAQLAEQGLNLEMYCQFMKADVQKLRNDARAGAIISLKVQKTIEEVVKLEKLEVTDEEMEAALEVVCRQNNMTTDMLKPHIDAEFTAAITRSILMGKVMRLIRDAAEVTEG